MKMASSEAENGPLLLDVNALLALGWPSHQFHRAVVARLERKPQPIWATCALTQLGFVRLSSNPSVVGLRKRPDQALALLAKLVQDDCHKYLEPHPSLLSVATYFKGLLGHRQVTDAYLLATAVTNDAILLTLDRRVLPTGQANKNLEVIVE